MAPKKGKGSAAPRSFPTGGVVGPEDLVGREPVLADLFERVYAQRNSVVLTGARQTGKSSVVSELIRRIRAKGDFGITIDCSLAVNVEDFARLVASATYDQSAAKPNAFGTLNNLIKKIPRPMLFQSDTNLALAFHSPSPTVSTTQQLVTALELAGTLAREKGVQAVVVFDEFPTLRKLDAKLIDQVRAVLQRTMSHASYIFMGSEVGILEELFRSRRSMPFRLGTVMQLPAPTRDEWLAYMRKRFRELGHPLVNGEAASLYDFCGAHPRDLMELCQNLLALRTLAGASRPDDVPLAQQQTYDALRRYFEELWNGLDGTGVRTVARRIALGQRVYAGKSPAVRQVKRAIDTLEREGVIHKTARGTYEFTEPLFGKFVEESGQRS